MFSRALSMIAALSTAITSLAPALAQNMDRMPCVAGRQFHLGSRGKEAKREEERRMRTRPTSNVEHRLAGEEMLVLIDEVAVRICPDCVLKHCLVDIFKGWRSQRHVGTSS